MKVVDTLAAIGVMTVIFIAAKTVLCVNELVNGPTRRSKKERA